MKIICLLIVSAALFTTCQGCAAILAGYLIGDGISRSRQQDTCHANIREINAARLSKGQEPWPDQCAS